MLISRRKAATVADIAKQGRSPGRLNKDERAFHESQLLILQPELEANSQAVEDALQAIATTAFRLALDEAVLAKSVADAQAVSIAVNEAANQQRQQREAEAASVLRPVTNPLDHPPHEPEPEVEVAGEPTAEP